jgi:ribosomal protein S18 acetylase RimI-like enzyme
MAVASLGYRTDLMLLGLQGSVIEQHAGYQVVRTPANPTFYWGNFLLLDGPPAPGTISSWTSTFAREFPGAKHVALGVDGTDGDAGDQAELATAGLAVERNTVLTADMTSPPPHPNKTAQFRVLDSDADWLAALELQEAGHQDGQSQGWQGFQGRRLQAKRQMQAQGLGAWFGAFQDGRMVSGLGIFGDGGGIARFQDVDTHPDHRNQGLAGTLVYQAGQYAQKKLAARTLVIVAEPVGPAIRIYRSVGFHDAETQVQLQRDPPS